MEIKKLLEKLVIVYSRPDEANIFLVFSRGTEKMTIKG